MPGFASSEFDKILTTEKEKFSTGAVRDVGTDKIRWDLLPLYPLLRVANVYGDNAPKYGDDNWLKGMPFKRTCASIDRHYNNWKMRGKPKKQGDDDLAQAVWGLLALLQYEQMIKCGMLPASLDDRAPSLELPESVNQVKAIPARKSQVPIEISTLLGMGCPNEVAHQIYDGITRRFAPYANNTGPYIYVAGPMRKVKDFNFPLFDEARDALIHAGWRVISPADIDRAAMDNVTTDEQATASTDRYVERDVWALRLIKKLSPNDGAIIMLPMWAESDGASAEYALARWLRLTRYQYNPMTKEAPVCPKS